MFALLAICIAFCAFGQPLNALPSDVVLKTKIRFDNTFLDLHNGDVNKAAAWIKEVVKKAKPLLLKIDVIKVHLKVVGAIEHKDIIVTATKSNLKVLQKKPYKAQMLTVYFSGDQLGYGLSANGRACSGFRGKGVAIVSSRPLREPYDYVIAVTARLLAHELGHTIGMHHDDENQNGGPCNEPAAMMAPTVSYNTNSWTSCSKDEFADWFTSKAKYSRRLNSNCMKVSDFGFLSIF